MPGDNVNLEIVLIAPIAMEKGVRFAIREGGRTIGAGTVTEIVHDEAESHVNSAIHRAVARTGRAPVSKTGCWGFESLLPCQSSIEKPA